MTPISSQADDNEVHQLDTGHIPSRNPPVTTIERNHIMANHGNQTSPTQRPAWQAPLFSGLVGVAAGTAIGAGTGMWWMMGVLGGVFSAFGFRWQPQQQR